MALTRLDRTGDGSTTRYSVNFDLGYLRQEYVYVYLEGNEYTNQLSYTWVNSSQIELDAPVPSGQVFSIRRIVPRDRIVNDYEDGAILREDNLDDSFLQAIMILQEIQDGYIEPDGDFKVDSNLDMLGNEIENCIKLSGLLDTDDKTAAISLGQARNEFVNVSGDRMLGDLDFGGNKATNLEESTLDKSAATYGQVLRLVADRMYQGVGTSPLLNGRQIGDGVTTVFTTPSTSYTPPETLFVWIDGVAQRALEDFNVRSDGKVVFNTAPPVNSLIDITWFEPHIEVSNGITPIQANRQVGDGTETVFSTPAIEMINPVELEIHIDGVRQRANTDYTTPVLGEVLFGNAPPINSFVDITWFKPQIVRAGTGVGFVSVTHTGDGTATHFGVNTSGSLLEDDQIISIDGLLQEPITDFVVVGSQIAFSEPPPNYSRIVIRSVLIE